MIVQVCVSPPAHRPARAALAMPRSRD